MGQMVSLNACVSGGSIVRVMRTDGEFDEFDFPCVAAEVMLQNPGYLVVHCTPVDKNALGQRSKITILLPDQPMLGGQPYMLYPIPDHYKKSLQRSKSFSMLKKRFESGSTPAISPAERRQGRRKALKLLFTRLNLATYVASTIRGKEEEVVSPESPSAPEDEQEIEEEYEKKALTLQLPPPSDFSYGWRPILTTIPESPLGFHTMPQSPIGLYRMDGGVPASPLSVGSRSIPPLFVAPSS